MQKLKIILSFDHELSLGGARSYQKNLFEPTRALFDLAKDLNVPLSFFTDVCCALRFYDWDLDDFYKPYCKQLIEAISLGHEVQLHLHPHWMSSSFNDGAVVPSADYTMAHFTERRARQGIIRKGITFLNETCSKANNDYQCIAYRGGGYSLHLYENLIKDLHHEGIRIDSSIAKGMMLQTPTYENDYRYMPQEPQWHIGFNGNLQQPQHQGILEIPIASKPRTPLNNTIFLINRLLKRQQQYDSTGLSLKTESPSILGRIKRMFPSTCWILSFDNGAYSLRHTLKVLDYHITQHKRYDTVICSACSHPKSMGSYQRLLMAEFVKRVREIYGNAVEFVTFQDIYEEYIATN